MNKKMNIDTYIEKAIAENSSNGALIDGYMEFGYYLSYIPERQLLLGDIMGSGDTALESYSFDASRASLVAEDVYLGTDRNNTGRNEDGRTLINPRKNPGNCADKCNKN